jgi:hypothetical protein
MLKCFGNQSGGGKSEDEDVAIATTFATNKNNEDLVGVASKEKKHKLLKYDLNTEDSIITGEYVEYEIKGTVQGPVQGTVQGTVQETGQGTVQEKDCNIQYPEKMNQTPSQSDNLYNVANIYQGDNNIPRYNRKSDKDHRARSISSGYNTGANDNGSGYSGYNTGANDNGSGYSGYDNRRVNNIEIYDDSTSLCRKENLGKYIVGQISNYKGKFNYKLVKRGIEKCNQFQDQLLKNKHVSLNENIASLSQSLLENVKNSYKNVGKPDNSQDQEVNVRQGGGADSLEDEENPQVSLEDLEKQRKVLEGEQENNAIESKKKKELENIEKTKNKELSNLNKIKDEISKLEEKITDLEQRTNKDETGIFKKKYDELVNELKEAKRKLKSMVDEDDIISKYDNDVRNIEEKYQKEIKEYNLLKIKTNISELQKKKEKEQEDEKNKKDEYVRKQTEQIKNDSERKRKISEIKQGELKSASPSELKTIMIRRGHAKTIRQIKKQVKNYLYQHVSFVTKEISNVINYLNYIEKLQIDYGDKANALIKDFKSSTQSLSTLTIEFITGQLYDNVKNQLNEYNSPEIEGYLADPRYIIELRNNSEQLLAYITNSVEKILYLYRYEYTIMDIIFDNQFILLYILKAIIFGSLVVSLLLSEKIFSDMYMRKVYGEALDPPHILILLGITLAINFGFLMFVITFLFLIMFLFGSPNGFIINKYLIKNFVMDYAVVVILFSLFAIIIGTTIQGKKYFRYKTEGLRALRAYKNILISIGAILFALPFYILF